MQQIAILFCLLLLSCSKDSDEPTTSGTWTVGSQTFTAIDYGRGPVNVQWFDKNNDEAPHLNGVVLGFSERLPMEDTTFGFQTIPTVAVNVCNSIRVIMEGNTPGMKTYTINRRIRGQQSIGSVFTDKVKRYMNINEMKVYLIADDGTLLDSTTFSARKLEY